MKRHFWTRLISAIVTMAMAFSILAVPASASQPGWVLKVEADGDELYITDLCIKAVREDITANQLALIKKAYIAELKAQEYRGAVPEDAAFGIKGETDPEITWLTVDSVKQGVASGSIRIPGLDEIEIPTESTGNVSVSSGNSDGGAGAALAIGGAAVVAVTGVYLYTHPEVVQQVKDFFHDFAANVQAKVQNLIPAHNVVEVPAGG